MESSSGGAPNEGAPRAPAAAGDAAAATPGFKAALPVVGVLLVAFFWFYRHFYPCLKPDLPAEEASLLGAAVAAAVAIGGILKETLTGVADHALRLAAKYPKLILSLIFPFAVLNVVTTSICITFEGAAAANSRFNVWIEGADNVPSALSAKPAPASANTPHAEPPVCSDNNVTWHPISTDNPTWAMRYYFHRTRRVRFKICETGKRYEVESSSLPPGKPVHLQVPGSFAIKDFHILALIPWGMAKSLAVPGVPLEEGAKAYRLVVRIKNRDYPISDIRRRQIAIGAGEDDIALVLDSEGALERDARIRQRIYAIGESEELSKMIKALIEAEPLRCSTPELASGDRVEILYGPSDQPASHLLSVTVHDRPGIQTVALGSPLP